MRTVLLLFGLTLPAAGAEPFPKFTTQEIDSGLKIGYAVIVADVNGDGKPDLVVVDQHKVVWYENPTWKKRTMLEGQTKPDNVCIAAHDIDGDGQIDFVIGAGWKPFDTQNPGTLQWLKRGKTLDDPWTLHRIPCDEPMVHRVQFASIDGAPALIMAPLMGRDATAKGNWLDGRPVRILGYRIPKEPTKPEAWKPVVMCEELHVVHNFATYEQHYEERSSGGPTFRRVPVLLTASYEGITEYRPRLLRESTRHSDGNQANPSGSRGSSEIAVFYTTGIQGFGSFISPIATVEPWHGNQIMLTDTRYGKVERTLLDDHLRWGHAIKWLDGDTVVAGVRDDPNPKLGDTFKERRGVRLYAKVGAKWERMLLDEGGVAVEDLAVADLDGDGKPEIIAVGRATGNCRIYWNKGK